MIMFNKLPYFVILQGKKYRINVLTITTLCGSIKTTKEEKPNTNKGN